jgi:hypothetical protein
MEDGSSIQPQPLPNAEHEGSTAEFEPNIGDANLGSRSNHQPQQPQDSDDNGGVEELRSLYPNLFGIVPDPFFSYTDVSNPLATGATCTLSESPSTLPNKYTDRSSLLPIILKHLPSKSDAIEMMNSYYQTMTIEWGFSQDASLLPGVTNFFHLFSTDPVPRGRLLKEFLIPCYDNFENTPAMRRGLALLYAVFALGKASIPESFI